MRANWNDIIAVFFVMIMLGVAGTVVYSSVNQTKQMAEDPKQHKQHFKMIVADTAEKRRIGLGGRPQLRDDEGMLFPFNEPKIQCFWNKNIEYPVTLAFFDENWKMLESVGMAANSSEKVCSHQPIKYAVEVNFGKLPAMKGTP
jgi:uncharacterized membrane protein (UPF0127 family)